MIITLQEEFILMMQKMYPDKLHGKLNPKQVTDMRKAFYGGATCLIIALTDEKDPIARGKIIGTVLSELDNFGKELIKEKEVKKNDQDSANDG